jgi:hypothetical protein
MALSSERNRHEDLAKEYHWLVVSSLGSSLDASGIVPARQSSRAKTVQDESESSPVAENAPGVYAY